MIDGGADDRQPERDIDAGKLLPFTRFRIYLEAEQLDRNVPLVVIHRHHRVVLARTQLDEHGIAGDRADHIKAVGDRFTVFFDGKQLYEATDKRITAPGRVALWSKADSVTQFVDLSIEPLP